MDKSKIRQFLINGWLRNIPEHAKSMESNLSWAKHFKAESATGQIPHEQKWATHHMNVIRDAEKYLNEHLEGQIPSETAAIIAKADATYNEIMNINN